MFAKQASERYADTLLKLAKEQNSSDATNEDMGIIRQALRESELLEAIQSPIIPKVKKKELCNKIFNGKISGLSLGFLNLLIDKGREEIVLGATEAYTDLYYLEHNIVPIRITTASELNSADYDALIQKVKAQYLPDAKLEIDKSIDPNLVGGFILEFNNQRVDASVKNGLNKLTKIYSN